MVGTSRLLITGSRDWRQVEVLSTALRLAAVQMAGEGGAESAPVLVSGACPSGADAQAELVWNSWGLEVERHPARWDLYGRRAGFVRNEEMVDSLDKERDLVIAFIRNGSNGATGTMNYALGKGYRVWLYRDDDRREVDENVRAEAAEYKPRR